MLEAERGRLNEELRRVQADMAKSNEESDRLLARHKDRIAAMKVEHMQILKAAVAVVRGNITRSRK